MKVNLPSDEKRFAVVRGYIVVKTMDIAKNIVLSEGCHGVGRAVISVKDHITDSAEQEKWRLNSKGKKEKKKKVSERKKRGNGGNQYEYEEFYMDQNAAGL